MEQINKEVNAMLKKLYIRKCIGRAHMPEEILLKKVKRIKNKKYRKKIEKQWKELENCKYIIRMKKRTKKGMDFHVCLNPKVVFEIEQWLED
jgi:hypothetical protein